MLQALIVRSAFDFPVKQGIETGADAASDSYVHHLLDQLYSIRHAYHSTGYSYNSHEQRSPHHSIMLC